MTYPDILIYSHPVNYCLLSDEPKSLTPITTSLLRFRSIFPVHCWMAPISHWNPSVQNQGFIVLPPSLLSCIYPDLGHEDMVKGQPYLAETFQTGLVSRWKPKMGWPNQMPGHLQSKRWIEQRKPWGPPVCGLEIIFRSFNYCSPSVCLQVLLVLPPKSFLDLSYPP